MVFAPIIETVKIRGLKIISSAAGRMVVETGERSGVEPGFFSRTKK